MLARKGHQRKRGKSIQEKGATSGALWCVLSALDQALPVALSTEIVMPGPMVELSAIFFI